MTSSKDRHCYTFQVSRMQAIRQHIVFEFFEKLFAALALAFLSPLSPLAFFFLFGRRVCWNNHVPKLRQARFLAWREVALLSAAGAGAGLCLLVRQIAVDPLILTVGSLVASFGFVILAEQSVSSLLPRFGPKEWSGPSVRNLLGWLLLPLAVVSFARYLDLMELLAAGVIAAIAALALVGMAYHRGEPVFVPLGAFVFALGILIWNPWVAAFGFGWLLSGGVLATHNLKSCFLCRGVVACVGASLGLISPSWVPVAASLLVLALALEFWRFLVRMGIYVPLRLIHRFRVYNLDHVAADGAGIVMSNHVTLADGWLLGSMTQRMVRFLVFDAYYSSPASRFLLNLYRTIPISQGARREAIESLRKARGVIEGGHFAGIFPEGGITRSGHLHPFQKGFTRIVAGTEIPVIPAYMNGLWTSFASFSEAKMNLRLGRFFRPFEIEFAAPLPPTVSAGELWRAVKSLEVNAAFRDVHYAELLPVAFLEAASRHSKLVAYRGQGIPLSYGELAESALLLARHINQRLNRKARIGVFLPEGRDKVIAHVALAISGHVAMEIPALSGEELHQWRAEHGLGMILTSQSFAESNGYQRQEGLIFIGRSLEKLHSRQGQRSSLYKLLSAKRAFRQVCPYSMRKDSAASIVTSPRGPIVLSHRGLWAAAHSARRVLWLKPGMTVRNRIPLHRAPAQSLGFWLPLLNGATLVGTQEAVDFELLDKHNYAEAHPDSRNVLIAGQIPETDERYLPFYECAEASGFLSLSSPAVDFMSERQTGTKAGTFGRLPFGLEMREFEAGIALRSPARLLRYLDSADPRNQSQTDDWLEVPEYLSVNEQCFVEQKATLEPQTSSTQPLDRTTLHPQGE